MNFEHNYDVIQMLLDEGYENTCESLAEIKKYMEQDPEARSNNNVLARKEKYETEASILKNVLANFEKGVYEVRNKESLEVIADKIHFYLIEIEHDIFEQITEDCISVGELEDAKALYSDLSKTINDMDLEKYQSNLKPNPEAFINKINYINEKEGIKLTLKASEMEVLKNVFNHINDHETWMYEVFNGEALRGVSEKINQLSK